MARWMYPLGTRSELQEIHWMPIVIGIPAFYPASLPILMGSLIWAAASPISDTETDSIHVADKSQLKQLHSFN